MRAQRGAALLMALIIVTLIVTLAGAMVWQQWRAVQVEAAERARVQSAWILTGALDWARLILREDARTGGADHLGEPWAVPLAEARLSTFLAADKDNTDDAPDAFLSGSISDEHARYNLANLVADGKVVFGRRDNLLTALVVIGGLGAGHVCGRRPFDGSSTHAGRRQLATRKEGGGAKLRLTLCLHASAGVHKCPLIYLN